MLSNNEKTAYLRSLHHNFFSAAESNYFDSLGELIRQINVNDTPKGQPLDKWAAAPVVFNQRKIEHPGIVHHTDKGERHKYRKPVVVKTTRLKEELGELIHRFDIFQRRMKSITAFTKRMLWSCDNFGDITIIEPEQFSSRAVFTFACNILENNNIEYDGIPIMEVSKAEQFHLKEAEAIKKIDQHILIEQLTG